MTSPSHYDALSWAVINHVKFHVCTSNYFEGGKTQAITNIERIARYSVNTKLHDSIQRLPHIEILTLVQ